MKRLPSPKQVLTEIPLTVSEQDFVLKSRNQIRNCLNGIDSRPLLIIGPCSLYDFDATLEYADKLKQLQEEVSESFLICMRAYYEKPRTQLGWRGLFHDPHLDGSYDIEAGIWQTRKWLKALVEKNIPLATEFLDITSPGYFEDMISWGCVGARTVASPLHRLMASGLNMPVGFKNTPDGNIETALEAIEVAKTSQTYLAPDQEGYMNIKTSSGNPSGHLVLRGGRFGPNYNPDIIQETLKKTRSLLVDCSHDNSQKKPDRQIEVFNNVFQQMLAGQTGIRGLMLESFLHSGNQPIGSSLKYGVSVTDPCLDIENTRTLILKCADSKKPCAALL